MTKSELKAKLERLERTRRIDHVRSGSPAIVALRIADGFDGVDTIGAVAVLRAHGVKVLRAKRAVEAAVDDQLAVLEIPLVGDVDDLRHELAAGGFAITVRTRDEPNVQIMRERLGLTQEQFALRFGLDVDAVRNWEHGRRAPDTAARSLLKVIARFPDAVSEAQNG